MNHSGPFLQHPRTVRTTAHSATAGPLPAATRSKPLPSGWTLHTQKPRVSRRRKYSHSPSGDHSASSPQTFLDNTKSRLDDVMSNTATVEVAPVSSAGAPS